jgi:holin-like protein
MLIALSVILLCQLAGEALARAAQLPLPGPVLGMGFLFCVMLLRDRFAHTLAVQTRLMTIEPTASSLLAHLSLMFVPAGVGVVRNLGVLAHYGVQLFLALILSTFLTLVVSVAVFRMVSRLLGETDTGELS